MLSRKGVEFEEKNVSADGEALRELVEVHKSRATPTLVIGDQVLIGFDPAKIEAAVSALD